MFCLFVFNCCTINCRSGYGKQNLEEAKFIDLSKTCSDNEDKTLRYMDCHLFAGAIGKVDLIKYASLIFGLL